MFENLWKCNECGHVFENDEILKTDTLVGECHGEPSYSFEPRCPHCGSTDFDEATRCDICDEAVPTDSLKGGACPACWEKIKEQYEHSAVKMAELFKEDGTEFELNPFLVWAFNEDREKIEEVLLNYLVGEEKRAVFWGEEPVSYVDFLEGDEEKTVYNVQKVGDVDE